MEISLKNGVRLVKFNNPKKKNAINKDMYLNLLSILNKDTDDDNVVITIITGNGDYYSSGNDFISIMEQQVDENDETNNIEIIHNLVKTLINYPKLLIAVLNGPAIGIAATTALLCDIIYASDIAYLATPFLKIGLCAEGCSSLTFPLFMGRSKASELLFFGEKLTAIDGLRLGIFAKIIPSNQVDDFIENNLMKFGSLPIESVKINKQLINNNFKKMLNECNKRECDQLVECSQSELFFDLISQMVSKKSKL